MRDIQQVPHHPARGAFRAGAGTSHGEGNIRVAACAEVEYVLGTADGTKRTLYRRVLQANLDRATLRDTHQIAEHVVFLDREQACRERLVMFGQALHELLQRHVFQPFGDQRLVGNFFRFDLAAHHTGQDDGLPGHVEPREVVAGVRLGIVEVHRLPDRLGEGPASLDRAYDEAQGAARAGLYLQDLVARLQEGIHGGDDGHPGPHRGLVPETVGNDAPELLVLRRAAGERPLVGEDEVGAALDAEEVEIEGAPVHGHVYHGPRETRLGRRAEHAFQRLDAQFGEAAAFLLQAYRLWQKLLARERARGVGDGAVSDLDAF